ncbi:hypothetical protein [Streptomyces sp. NPDC006551]|uniref:hypothetical protein n=1 Tax=Streptomyces sp. NPDC006551 TaxID=3157178 RepID=UPI0033B7316F
MRRKAFVYLISCAAAVTTTVLGAATAQAADSHPVTSAAQAGTTAATGTNGDAGDSWGWD